MKQVIFFTTLLFLFTTLRANGQIENEIRTYIDSTELIVSNGRKMLEARLTDGDIRKAGEIYRYLTEVTKDKNMAAFNYTEEIYLNIILCDWKRLLEVLGDYENLRGRRVYSDSREILYILHDKIKADMDSLTSCYRNYGLADEDTELLDIIFYLIAEGSENKGYNTLLESFRKSYPLSRYNLLLKEYLPGKYLKAGMGFSIGTGMVYTTGNLYDSFNPAISGNMSCDFNIGRAYISLYFQAAGMKLKEPFSVTDGYTILDFGLDEKFSYIDGGLKLGYFMIRGSGIQVAPYLTIGGSTLESRRYDSYDDSREFKVFNSFIFGPGLHTEVKITDFRYPAYYGFDRAYFSIRLQGGYNIVTTIRDDNFRGNVPYFAFAAVFGLGNF